MKCNWWWALGAAAVLVLAIMAAMPNQPRTTQPNPITQRQAPNRPSTPSGTPVRGGDVRTPQNSAIPGPVLPDTQARLGLRAENAAASVDGVRSAWAVVTDSKGATRVGNQTGKTALTGVLLESSLKGAARKSTLDEVADAVRDVPGIDKVAVTDDPKQVERIRRISDGLSAGRLPAMYTTDMRQLADQMLSSAK